MKKRVTGFLSGGLAALFLICITGCASTPKIDWASRIGSYTMDEAIVEFGPPDKSATLTDGSTVAEWMVHRGYSRGGHFMGFHGYHGHPYYGGPLWYHEDPPMPDVFMRLVFDPEGKLKDYRRHYK